MIEPNLSFKKIEIRRMPGFPRGGLDLDALCPGVNIIYGPNASGKTTISNAIQKLLRPGDPPHQDRSLRAMLLIEGRPWTIEVDLGRIRCQRDGADADPPILAPPDVGNRYVLAMHDLLRSEDGGDLALEIVKESAGGYDLAKARESLGLKEKPSGRTGAASELEKAIAAHRAALRRQEDLVDREKELHDLQRQKTEADRAAVQLEWLKRAIAHADARQRLDLAQQKHATFPAGVKRLSGNEIEELAVIRAKLQKAEQSRRDEQTKLRAAQACLEQCGLPQDGIPSELLATLRQKGQRLQAIASEIRTAEGHCQTAGVTLEQARRSLGPDVREDQVQGLDLAAIDRLAQLARRMENHRAQTKAAEALEAWLGPDSPASSSGATAGSSSSVLPDSDPVTLRRATQLLEDWLAEDRATGRRPAWHKLMAAAMAVLLVALSLLLARLVHPSWLALLPVAILLMAWIFWRREDPRVRIRVEYENLGIDGPATWSADEVRRLAADFQQRAAQLAIAHEKAAKWGDLAPRLEDLQRQQEELDRQKAEWIARLGISIDAAAADETWLYQLASTINRVNQAREAHAAAAATLVTARQQHAQLLDELNAVVSVYGYPPADDPDLLASDIESLVQRREVHQSAQKDLDHANDSLARIDEELAEWTDREASLFDRLGLAPDQELTLHEWSRLRSDYLEADQELRRAQSEADAAALVLADQPNVLARPRDQLETELRQCQEQIQRLEAINQQIGQFEGQIADAKKETQLEAALAAEARCADALRSVRRQDYDALVGNVLVDALARQQREQERPGVFHRARQLFVQITQGRYRLDIHDADPPGFRAYDTSQDVGLALDELSSGTRLQLLLAVRVAFVERQERDVRLPLVLDETLANSDENRARQIIEAAIAVCRAGRQIFYLTAQHDEVGKWRAVLHDHRDVPHRLVDLAELRNFSQSDRVPPIDYEAPKPVEVPPPESDDWLTYGRTLGVPPLGRFTELGGVHLWYLIHESATLYRFLKQGVNRWGQFENLVQNGNDDLLRADADVYRRSKLAAEILQSALALARVGRGMPVDRKALADSGAVSATFIDSVVDLAAELSGDAKAILDALADGRVKGFRNDKRTDLAEYLRNGGYLDDRNVLTFDEIRDQVRPAVFRQLQDGLISLERFEQLIRMAVRWTESS